MMSPGPGRALTTTALPYPAVEATLVPSTKNQLHRRSRHRRKRSRSKLHPTYHENYAPAMLEDGTFQIATPPYSPYQKHQVIYEESEEVRWQHLFRNLDGWCEQRVQELGAQLEIIASRHAAYWRSASYPSQEAPFHA